MSLIFSTIEKYHPSRREAMRLVNQFLEPGIRFWNNPWLANRTKIEIYEYASDGLRRNAFYRFFIYLVLLVSILLPWFRIRCAIPCDIRISGSQAQSVVSCTNHASSNANIQWDELKYMKVYIININILSYKWQADFFK